MSQVLAPGEPLAYPVRNTSPALNPPAGNADERPHALGFYVHARTLAGMQKEAIVWGPAGNGRGWRMLSDEGPQLSGTDLAPFPLGYFAAGLQFCYLEQLVKCARARAIRIESLETFQDNWYTLTGSALRGDMTGGAKPADLLVKIRTDASQEEVASLVRQAEQSSPAHAVMREPLANTFACFLNGTRIPVTGLAPSGTPGVSDPAVIFQQNRPEDGVNSPQPIVSKLSDVNTADRVSAEVNSGLQAEQKRTLQIHGEGKLLDDGLLETRIQLLSPRGSTFRFVGQVEPPPGEPHTAPPSLAYFSAGIAFCFMTQLGRYAHIRKYPVHDYRVVQFNPYGAAKPAPNEFQPASAGAVDTHLFVDAEITADGAAQSARMSEQTCFLHAAMKGRYPTRLAVEYNGKLLPSAHTA